MLGRTNAVNKKIVLEELTITAGTANKTQTAADGKGYNKVTVKPTPSQTKSVTPGASQKTVTPDAGKLLSQVTVSGDADLVAGNIRKGIDIFGVTGTLVEGKSGVDFGEVTVAYASGLREITVAHSLGVTPSFVCIVPKTKIEPGSTAELFFGIQEFVYSLKSTYSRDYFVNDNNSIKSSSTITFKSTLDTYSGGEWHNTTYVWLALA